MRRLCVGFLLMLMALCLCSCSVLLDEDTTVQPDLRLLERPVYEEDAEEAFSSAAENTALRMDLWLDASQTMGGINQNEDSMYPHHGVRYREGGFHYLYKDSVGWYDSLLRSMLNAVEGSRVRILRYGNERLPEEYLLSEGVADETTTPDGYRSLRRDMLTYAIDPMPKALNALATEKMADSFYALGSEMLNQMESLNQNLLENPDKLQSMSEALTDQIDAIEDGRDERLTALANDSDYPLLYALDNLDLTRLSVITCDPASIRRLNAVSSDGSPVALVQHLLEERGVFDKGLTAGLYAFTLDYMGQISSLGPADLSEPLIWGELKYLNNKGTVETELVMPRALLMLVIGNEQQTEDFTTSLNRLLSTEAVYQELRGPAKQELVYAKDGQTVVQEPFGFAYEYTQITRPVLPSANPSTEGVTLETSSGTVDAETRLVSITQEEAVQITVTIPVQNPQAALTDLSVSVQDALFLSRTIPNAPDASIPEDAQVIALRDTLYVYEHQPCQVSFDKVEVRALENALSFTFSVPASMEPGYYRLHLSADYAAGAVAWQTDPWIADWNVTLSNEQISTWETFTALMTEHERDRENIARTFQHAWGEATTGKYHGMDYPDCPPVYKAQGLSELVSQLQKAADMKQTPCLRYTCDLFVNNR